jgi:hypothetical protein
MSLEVLITNWIWEYDFPISITNSVVAYLVVNEPAINEMRRKVTPHMKTINIMMDTLDELIKDLGNGKATPTEMTDRKITEKMIKMEVDYIKKTGSVLDR